MENAIKDFIKQFSFKPQINNKEFFRPSDSFVIGGMGGSHLAADLMKVFRPEVSITVHSDYGIPQIDESLTSKSLFIASSYSGNTEETLDFAEKAFEQKRNLAIIAVGGKLIDFAIKNELPYIQLSDTEIQPRSALGFSLIAMATLMNKKHLLDELWALGNRLDTQSSKEFGNELAKTLKNSIPVIYSSRANFPIAYNWKIKFNETGKIPAFCNYFPELNHNETAGFDVIDTTKHLSSNFHFIFLSDESDHPRIVKRMHVTRKLYEDRGLKVSIIELKGSTLSEKIFSSLLTADWAALNTALSYGGEPEQVKIIEDLKKMIA